MEKKCKCNSNENEKHECKCKAKQEDGQVTMQEAIDMLGEAFESLLETIAKAFAEAAVNVANELNSARFEVDEDKVLADMKWLYSNGGREAIADKFFRSQYAAAVFEDVSDICKDTIAGIAKQVGVYEEIQDKYIANACNVVLKAVSEKLADAKPKHQDSWGEVFDDSKLDPFAYCKKVGYRLSTCENAERYKSSDLMRRVNALREREATRDVN